MPSDRDPPWAAGFRTSADELNRLKQSWLQAGHDAWNAASRTGHNVVARTQSELMALGKSYMEQQAAQQQGDQAAADAVGDGIARAKPVVARVARQGIDVARSAAQQGANLAAGVVDRGVLAALPIVERVVGMGTADAPGPGDLLEDWRRGDGRTRELSPGSSFSRQFASAKNVQADVGSAINDPSSKIGRWDDSGHFRGGGNFGYLDAAKTWNPAPQVIGSYHLEGQRTPTGVDWTASNTMGRHSFYGGHRIGDWNRDLGDYLQAHAPALGLSRDTPILPTIPDAISGPLASTRQVIHFRTDAQGRPIG